MAMEGYVARLPSSVVLRPQVRTGQAGMALAQGVAALGETLGRVADQNAAVDERIADSNHQIAMEQKRRDQSAVLAIAMGRVADLKLEAKQAMADARSKTQLGAFGHEAAATEKMDALSTKLLDEIGQMAGGDPDVMERLTPMVRQARDGVLSDEFSWARGQRAQAQGMGVEKAINAIASEQQAKPDPQSAIAALIPIKQMVDAADWDGNAKAKVMDSALKTAFSGTLNGLIDSGQHDGVTALLDNGTLNGVFDADEQQLWRRRAAAGAKEQALEAERRASDLRTAAMDGLKSIKVDIDNDGDVPQDKINAAFAAAKAAGVKEADLKDFAYLAEGAAQRSAMRRMTTPQLETAAGALRQKVSAGQATAEDERRLERAEKALDQRDSKDGESLSGLWNQGPAGQMQVMAQMAQLPVGRRNAVASKMGKPELSIITGLNPEVQRLGLIGMQIGSDRKGDYMPDAKPGRSETSEKALRDTFDTIIGGVKTEIGGQYDAMRQAALAIYAGRQTSQGAAKGWVARDFEWAVKVAFGATMRRDGTWQGGVGKVRDKQVYLPDQMNESDFDRLISRFDYAGMGATYRDGRPASRADILAHYRPTLDHADPDGSLYYRLEGPNGALWDAKAKRQFLLPVRPR